MRQLLERGKPFASSQLGEVHLPADPYGRAKRKVTAEQRCESAPRAHAQHEPGDEGKGEENVPHRNMEDKRDRAYESGDEGPLRRRTDEQRAVPEIAQQV